MLVLASASPRRQELLQIAGISFTVQPADVDETPLQGESAQECAERLAREKALKIAQLCPLDFVLGADTVVVVSGEILGKPTDANDAARMLRLLSGREHQVITGVCLVRPNPRNPESVHISSETTLVTMTEISDDEIREYVATGEPMDKAGAYAIQGIASRWVTHLDGCYFNVMGLPVPLVYRMLQKHHVLG